ncbi:histidine phosphatase family protein [Falsiroseomonas ponticola]|uniref:histidine phosphatase family protein n=1 Tax=Falsiroseomonas ponticola TaxID=2786951 RepID=UPI001931368E|nr:histidine phosphatase family protein [Roseomonas ponticola]
MPVVRFITHPDVMVDPARPVPEWHLSPRGIHRARLMLGRPWVARLRSLFSSAERKAVDTAAILAAGTSLDVTVLEALHENDRSATGYLPGPVFEAMADAFFARPEESVRGWERAVDAQARIVAAVERVLAMAPPGDIAIIAHGAVGALLLCRLKGVPISRAEDQPGRGGGNLFTFDRASRALRHGWRPIEGG